MNSQLTDELKDKIKLTFCCSKSDKVIDKKVEDIAFNLKGFALTLLKMKMEMEAQYASR